jgi:hypothetical protein
MRALLFGLIVTKLCRVSSREPEGRSRPMARICCCSKFWRLQSTSMVARLCPSVTLCSNNPIVVWRSRTNRSERSTTSLSEKDSVVNTISTELRKVMEL